MVMISVIVRKIWQNSDSVIKPYKNHILYGAMATSTVRNNCTCLKSIIWIPDYHLIMPWKGYKNFIFFTKFGRHIWSDTPVHKRWNTLSNFTDQIWAYVMKYCTSIIYKYLAVFYAPYVMWCLFFKESMQKFVIYIVWFAIPFELCLGMEHSLLC